MKWLLSIFMLLPTLGLAQQTDELFNGLAGTSACYGRDYTTSELRNLPARSVKRIRLRIGTNVMPVYGFSTHYASLDIRKKTQPNVALTQLTTCTDFMGKAHCAVDCDGGALQLSRRANGDLAVVNLGISLLSGCEGENRRVFLEPTPNGDQVYWIQPKPLAECAELQVPSYL